MSRKTVTNSPFIIGLYVVTSLLFCDLIVTMAMRYDNTLHTCVWYYYSMNTGTIFLPLWMILLRFTTPHFLQSLFSQQVSFSSV